MASNGYAPSIMYYDGLAAPPAVFVSFRGQDSSLYFLALPSTVNGL
jgi:hypothetical protein